MKNSILLWGVGGALVLAGVIALGLLSFQEACRDFKAGRVTIGDTELSVAIADTTTARRRGLIGCTELPEHSGMYFPYEQPQDVQFWMKGMRIPLDIVWVTNGRVIGIERNVPPQDELVVDPPLYRPLQPVTGVLEVAGNAAAEYDIKVGDLVQFAPG